MVQTRGLSFYLSAGLILAITSLLGCAGQARTTMTAPQPPGTSGGRVVNLADLLGAANQAFQSGKYQDAQRMYQLARKDSEALSPEQKGLVNSRLAAIETKLHAAKPAAKPAGTPKPAAQKQPAQQKPATAQKQPQQVTAAQKAAEQKAAAQKAAKEEAARKEAERKAAAQKAKEEAARKAEAAAAKKLADAHAAYDAGMKAYDEKDYLTAQKDLRAAKDSGVDFGGFFGSHNRALRSRLTEVDETLNKLQTAYKAGKEAYDRGDYATAQNYLISVTKRDISLGKDSDADIQRMMSGIQEKIAQQRTAEQQKQEAEAAAARAREAQRAMQMEEQARKLAAESEALLKAQQSVQAQVAGGDKALAAGDLATAEKDLTAAQQALKDPNLAATRPMAGLSEQVNAGLARIAKARAAQKRLEDASKALAGMVQDAQSLAKTDLAGAEQKAADARAYAREQGVALTGRQAMALTGVEQAAERKFGLIRRLRREEYATLATMAKADQDAGHYGAAAQLNQMVAHAEPALAGTALREQAAKDARADQAEVGRQKQKATELAAGFDTVRQTLQTSGLEVALKARQDLIRQANDARLSTNQAVSIFNQADLSFLDKDARQAIANATESLNASSDRMLTQAHQQIEAARKAQAAPVKPLDQKDEAARYYDLAQKLHTMVVQGDTAQIGAVQQQMTDVALQMQVEKALHSLQQGNYDAAKKALDAASTQGASEQALKTVYTPARAQIDAAAAARRQLDAAEQALTAHDFAKASPALQQAQQAAPNLPQALENRLKGLAAVMNAVRAAEARLEGFSAANAQAIARVRQSLDQGKQRQAGRQAYVAALKTFFSAGQDEAAKAVADVVARPGLSVAESDNINHLVAGFGSAGATALAQAQKMLATSQSLYDAADYTGAAQALANVKASPAYSAGSDLARRTESLQKSITAKEQEARKLYEQAVAAYKAGNKAEVARLTAELTADYSHTQTYAQHR